MGNLCRKYLSTMFSKFFKSSPKDQKKEVSTMREILPRMELVDLRKRIEEFFKNPTASKTHLWRLERILKQTGSLSPPDHAT